jgi:hypothetical protein
MFAFRRSTILIGCLASVGAAAGDDPLDMPAAPAAAKRAPTFAELPRDAGQAQQAARDRWKPWEREDRPGPKRLPDPPPPSSMMSPAAARQTAPAQNEPLQIVPRETMSRTPAAAPPPRIASPTVGRQPFDDSLTTPPMHVPTPELEVFPAPARLSDSKLDLPIAPPMLGDQISPFLEPNNPRFRRAIVHQLGASRFKVADNNSPLPDQRGLFSFNYFDNPFDQSGRLYKGTGGFEFARTDRRMSVDLRGGLGLYTSDDSNVSFATNPSAVFKAVVLDGASFKASGGVGVSFPNGDTPDGAEETDFVVSPFVGWVWARAGSAWFLHGFEQFDVSLNDDGYRLQSDVGVGYWVRRHDPTKLITAFAPTVELHLYTPFDGSPGGDREGLPAEHVLNGTLGMTMYFGPADSLAIGVGRSLLGDRHYDWEGHLHFVHRF